MGRVKIIRVFPYRTSYTPIDEYAFVGYPPISPLPEHDEIHVSCTFTWDKESCEDLAFKWEGVTNSPVRLGGIAYHSETTDFIPGLYIKPNIIFTSRGCNNNCKWCIVPKVEGRLKEIHIFQGNIIQDNNFLQTSKTHKEKVFNMLRKQKQISFRGGLETELIDDHFISNISSLRIADLWLACDTDSKLKYLKKACEKLKKAGFNQNKIRCYVLIGDDMERNRKRLIEVFNAGAIPFGQLYRDFSDIKTKYSNEWCKFERIWQRPAITKAYMKSLNNDSSDNSYIMYDQLNFF